MNQYLHDTRYAAESLFAAITHESKTLAELLAQRESVAAREQAYDIAFQARFNHPAANYWYGEWVKSAEERRKVENEVAELQLRIADREFSISVLAGAVLQVAKQALSTVFGKPDNCPKTRQIFGQEIAKLIFQGRNQALHYEEPKKVDDRCVELFTAFADAGADPKFREARAGNSLATSLLSALEWTDYDAYQKDMVAILG